MSDMKADPFRIPSTQSSVKSRNVVGPGKSAQSTYLHRFQILSDGISIYFSKVEGMHNDDTLHRYCMAQCGVLLSPLH